jgi:hypothetical protein
MKARAATLDRHVGLRPPRDDNSSERIPLQYWKAAVAAGLGPSYGSAWLEPISEPPVFASPRT